MSRGFLSRRWLDALVTFQIVLTILVLSVIVVYTVQTAETVAELNRRQLEYVTQQNMQQICNQHDSLVALVKIGERLGLPTHDITIPSVEGLDCP